jgi:hypothetical protein
LFFEGYKLPLSSPIKRTQCLLDDLALAGHLKRPDLASNGSKLKIAANMQITHLQIKLTSPHGEMLDYVEGFQMSEFPCILIG